MQIQDSSPLAYLKKLEMSGSSYGIANMAAWAKILCNPEHSIPIVHVAGTNGKGSVCAMLESIFSQAGYKTGLYTSPHLVNINERFQINRSPIEQGEFEALIEKIKHAISNQPGSLPPPSYFEFLTLLAFLYFKEQKVDIAFIETGLGGRLDATNVVTPILSIITSIGLDHTDLLGGTLEEVASEKAGIIKPKTPVCVGEVPLVAQKVIQEKAQENQAPCHLVSPIKTIKTNLDGSYQQLNAAVVLSAIQCLNLHYRIKDKDIRQGLESVSWDGRWQTVSYKNQTLILDATHNELGARFLKEALIKLSKTQKPEVLIATSSLTRAQGILSHIEPYVSRLHLIDKLSSPLISAGQIKALISKPSEVHTHDSIARFLSFISSDLQTRTWIISGSIYLIADILKYIKVNS